MTDIFGQIYSQDTAPSDAYGLIQWKNTSVGMEVQCVCGHQSYVDGDYVYSFECPACHAKYVVGQFVRLIPLTPEQAKWAEDKWGFTIGKP